MLGHTIRSLRKQRRWFPCKNFTNRAGVERAVATESVDCVVIGAGVVGIAVARELALKGREVMVIESASTFGTGTSSRNSEVIHAGIYYPRNSLKVPSQSHYIHSFCVWFLEIEFSMCFLQSNFSLENFKNSSGCVRFLESTKKKNTRK